MLFAVIYAVGLIIGLGLTITHDVLYYREYNQVDGSDDRLELIFASIFWPVGILLLIVIGIIVSIEWLYTNFIRIVASRF